MPATVAIKGWDSKLYTGDGSGSSYVKWTEVKEFAIANPQREDIEATHLESPDETKEYIAGLKDTNEFTFTQNYIASDYQRAVSINGTTYNWKQELPDGTTLVFPGYLKGSAATPVPGQVFTVTHTVKLAGAVVVTP